MAKRIVLDLDYCIGCRSCEAACRSRFQGEARIRYGEISPTVYLPLACRHCQPDPLCAAACPFNVIKVDEKTGVSIQHSFHCVGCKSCILACPFGVLDESLLRRVSQKCNLCADREGGPRCVASCASGALKFLSDEEYEKKRVGIRFISRSPFWRRT
jgi:anaerobic carbon-monoxide dehydrogenase iron sulfur subunit